MIQLECFGLALDNYFGTWVGYLVGFSLGALGGLVIDTWEENLVGASLIHPLGLPPGMALGDPIVSLIGYICLIN